MIGIYALGMSNRNGNTAPKTTVVEGVEKVMPPTTTEKKAQKRLEVEARSTLMIGIPNEHQLKFNSIKDDKLLMKAIEKKFGRNAATKNTQKNLLKQQYKNFTALSSEMLNQNFDRLQKLVSQLDFWGETISQEDFSMLQAVNYLLLKVYVANTQVNASKINNLSDVFICAFLASQPNNPQLAHEDLQQIHPDDLEEMDLRWQMAMLTMRARRFLKNTCRKLTINGNESVSFDKSKVECYNCHKKRHFAKECRALRNQDYKNKESTRRTVPMETSTSTALVSCDGLGGYDWSDQAEEGPNYLLMAYSSLSFDSEKSELMVLAYMSGLESVEEKLEVYKENESIYSQDIKVLKFEIECKDIAVRELRKKLEIDQKEKDGIQFNVDKFENASKSLNKLIESQIIDNCKKGLGYNAVPLPYTGNFIPPTPDLSFTSLDEYVNKHVVENRKSDEEVSKVVRKSNDSPIIEDWVSDSEEENMSQTKTEKKTVKPSIAKIEFVKPKQQEKTARKTIKQVERHRQNTHSPRGNQKNWNNMMPQRLGSNFEMFNKACYVCGSFNHLQQSVEREGSTTGGGEERGEGGDVVCGWARVVMSSALSAVTYTSVYTDSEPGRVFWGADEEISDGGSPRVIVYGYDGLPMQPVAPPSPDYIPGPEDPQTSPVLQDEDEREAMFIQSHDPDYVPQPIYPEYIPLEDEHVFPVKEQPLPPVDSPTTESPEYVTESDPEEDPEEYEDDET
ncbi:ribonuclease H-like domain-containing protein [Tanacetum coccineum]